MAIVLVGETAGIANLASQQPGNKTYIAALSGSLDQRTMLIRGTIKAFDVGLSGNTNYKLKVFRDVGADWVFVGESPLYTNAAGPELIYNVPCWIPVEVGDYLGIYVSAILYGLETNVNPMNTWVQQAGDITITTAKAAWAAAGRDNGQLVAYVFTKVAPFVM